MLRSGVAPGIVGHTGGCLGRHLLEGHGPAALSPSERYMKIISIHLLYQLPAGWQGVAGSHPSWVTSGRLTAGPHPLGQFRVSNSPRMHGFFQAHFQ